MITLTGPFPLELGDVLGSTRRALSRWQAGAAPGVVEAEQTRAPGLYLALEGEALTGVWLVFGATWTDRGDPGESPTPPYASEVLTALTEAVWWERLTVAPRESNEKAERWTPLVVLEWPPQLASRSGVAVPGEPTIERVQVPMEDRVEAEEGAWLDDDLPTPAYVDEAYAEMETIHARPTELPWERSVVTVVRGELRAGGGSHRGRFALPVLDVAGAPVPLATWWAAAREQAPGASSAARLSAPLDLPGSGIAFAAAGWLDRGLSMRPDHAADIRGGTLHDRDVGGLLWARLAESGRVSAALFLAVLLVALLVWRASEPRARSFHAPPEPEPPPALSLCSVDNARFVRELRCQTAAMAVSDDGTATVCGDDPGDGPTATFTEAQVPDDVQPLWCGLRDRDLDGHHEPVTGVRWADLAAARACFNVLGYPDTYAAGGPGPRRPDVTAFFDERKLRIQPLVRLVHGLDSACEEVGRRARRQVEGAVMAAHIGDPTHRPDPITGQPPRGSTEAGRLREYLGGVAGRSLSLVERRCLLHGLRYGTDDALEYVDLCGPDVPPPPAADAWMALGAGAPLEPADPEDPDAEPVPSVLSRYVGTRFALDQDHTPVSLARAVEQADASWQCHVALEDPRLDVGGVGSGRSPVPRVWDLVLPVPATYTLNGRHTVRYQLLLDSGLRWLRARGDAGVCWDVVLSRLGDYSPVHPLLPERAVETWPSDEQQLCGQVCAAWYRVARSPNAGRWVTPGSDLDRCVDNRDMTGIQSGGTGRLDALQLPWNDDRNQEWTVPAAAELCAFNLLAQGWLAGGPMPLPIDGTAPQRWAGESEAGSLIAGGASDLAVQAAMSLDSYGGERSAATCGYAAAQCVVTQMLDAMASYPERPFTWAPTLQQRMSDLAYGKGGPRQTPWCRLVKPYLPRDDSRADGRLDYPCATAVADTVTAGMGLIEVLASGGAPAVAEEAP